MRARRAFTLLEVTLAAVIGSVIVLACLAVFGAMDGVDRALTRKLDETAEMAKLHLVMQRTFSTLVMSDQPPPRVARPGDTTGTAGTQTGTGTGGGARPSGSTSGSGSGSGSATSGSGSSGSGTALRSSTTGGSETTSGTTGASGRTTSGSSSTGSTTSLSSSSSRTGDSSAATDEKTPLGRFIIAPTATTPAVIGQPAAQRLEVVVKKAPLADPRQTEQTRRTITTTEVKLPAQSSKSSKTSDGEAIEGRSSDGKTASTSGTGSASTASGTGTGDQKESESAATRTTTLETTGEPSGVRGYFELVKESALPDYRPPRPGAQPPLESWALLWTPVPEGAATSTGTLTTGLTSTLPVEPLVVARGIASLRWRVFDDRERKDQFNAVWSNQLPAYVEMDVQTVSGLRASWLFEVEWGTGPEPGEAPAVAFGGGGGGGGQGGGGFRGRGEGQGGGPGRGLPGGGPQRIRRGEGQQQGGETAMPGQQRRRRDGQQAGQGVRRDGTGASGQPQQRLPAQPNPAQQQPGRPRGQPRGPQPRRQP